MLKVCYNIFGGDFMNRIKKLREENDITQEELAQKLEMSKGIISLYEKEIRKPSLEVLIKLSEIFDCSIDYLLGKTDVRKQGKIKLDDIDIAFASGVKGLNDENKETLINIMESLLAKQELEKNNKKKE
jgi:transcriptional regulator with XRE-family HTH domain